MIFSTMALMNTITNDIEIGSPLRGAIIEEDLGKIRELIQTDDNDITVDVVVEAIIKNNNDNLLKRFISELEYVKIIDGALVTEHQHVPVITFSIQTLAL